MKKIIKNLKEMLETLKHKPLLIGLVVMAVSADFILRALTVGSIFKVKPIITSIGLILIFSALVILMTNKRRKYMYLIVGFLLTALNVCNYLYYTHFHSFLSAGIFSQAKQLTEMKNSVSKSLDLKVLILLIPLVIYFYLYKNLEKIEYTEDYQGDLSKRNEVRSPLIIGLIFILAVTPTLTGIDLSRLVKQWNREYIVSEFGVYTFAGVDFIKSASVPRKISADYGEFDKVMINLVNNNKVNKLENEYSNILEGKDLYVIHYESVQNFAMNLSFEDGPVTPFLNKLTKESMFFENFYPQHSVGTSSDSEFTFNTSLYPINNRTVFIDHADKKFETIQNLLKEKGYHTMSMHGNNASFWNRNLMHPNLGYNEVIGRDDYIIDEEIGLGLSDMSFYRQSAQKLKQRKDSLNVPIMAKLISLTNHYPFDALDVYGDFDTGYLEERKISNYLKSMNYADSALEYWFAEMDNLGLLDNAAVVIYGDHHAQISKSDYEFMANYNHDLEIVKSVQEEGYIHADNAYLKQLQKTPLLIWTKDQSLKKKVSEPIGMIDVMPTLANMLNIDNKYQLGQDIFNVENNLVIFPDGSFLNKEIYYNASNMTVYDLKSNTILIEKEDFGERLLEKVLKVEESLDLSKNIIENDLIKYYQDVYK